ACCEGCGRARGRLRGGVGDIPGRGATRALYGGTQDKAPLRGVPPLRGTATLRFTEPHGRGWIEGGTRWSWRTNRLPLPTPGVPQISDFKKEWMVADLSMGLRTPSGQRFVFGARNVTDLSYPLAL